MTTEDFITALFCRVDDVMQHEHQVPQHPQAKLAPSEVVTLGLLYALKGRGQRAFYRWAWRDLKPLFPHLPERTRLFRLLAAHYDWTQLFLAAPTVLGICGCPLGRATALNWCIRCAKVAVKLKSARRG